MGYQLVEVKAGITFFTVTFKNIGTTEIDLLDVLCKKVDGTDWATGGRVPANLCNGEIKVQKMKGASGFFDTTYSYYSTFAEDGKTVIGWAKAGKVPVVRGEVKLLPGEGIIVQNGKDISGAFQVSGEVSLGTQYDVAPGITFSGNCTPVKIDLLDILCKKADGTDWATGGRVPANLCNGEIKVQKMKGTSGFFDTTYSYYSTFAEDGKTVIGWAKAGKVPVVRGEVTLEPGEGIIVQNGKDIPGLFVFPNPIPDSAK